MERHERLVAAVRVRDEIELLPWLLANLTYADKIVFVDGGSVDGSLEWMQDRAEIDRRIRVLKLESPGDPYHDETRHMRAAFKAAMDEGADWICYHDVDEIWSVGLQQGLRFWLSHQPRTQRRLCGAFMNYELAEGWRTYYPETSGMLMRLWNWIPEDYPDRGYPFAFHPPDYIFEAKHLAIYHINWACKERFKRKREWYEKWRGYPSWHPDEKFPLRMPLPLQFIYHPDPAVGMVGIDQLHQWIK